MDNKQVPVSVSQPVSISDETFMRLMSRRSQVLLAAARDLPKAHRPDDTLPRPMTGLLFMQAVELEELLDSYGARNNRRWRRFRTLIATLKQFADMGYELLHIRHALPSYHLLPIAQDFPAATTDTLRFISGVLIRAGAALLEEAQQLNMELPSSAGDSLYTEVLPPGRLPHDIETRKIDNVYETVTLLATEFLNLADQSRILSRAAKPPQDQVMTFTSSVNEELLRQLTQRFHNLQSLYDTFVSDTDVEMLDADLAILRGHVTVAMHLLEAGTLMAHYFERHVRRSFQPCPESPAAIVNPYRLLTALIDYALGFTIAYIEPARRLCQTMLKRYVEPGQIEVPIPVYRGFHVRPSTLISSIVLHYGTDIEVHLGSQACNAAIPLELFRLNEKINAEKRRYLNAQIQARKLAAEEVDPLQIADAVRRVILTLAEEGLIVVYVQPLEFTEQVGTEDDILLKCVAAEIARLQAEGKIDILTDVKVRFVGDKRVLEDIRILAESGYGEDRFGNNIPLPPKLSYLSR